MPKDAKVDVVLQRIDERIGDELTVVPQRVRRYGVNNIFTRTFSYLLGWRADGKPQKVEVTSAGALKVASVGQGLENIEFYNGVATDDWSGAIEFSHQVARLDVIVVEHSMWMMISKNAVQWQEKIRCLPNVRNIFDLSVKAVKVMRAEPYDVEYEIVGEW